MWLGYWHRRALALGHKRYPSFQCANQALSTPIPNKTSNALLLYPSIHLKPSFNKSTE
ncbi:hypothetical protein HHE02_02680 [Helicobacter heilmannii]|nr:hypothetical protein HHE02_02680 [Helicobacter heilmannii]